MNGKVPTLPRAKKLTPLSWDDDLWILAMRVSNQCQDTLEGFCINTHRFRKAGETSDFMVLRPGVFPDMISFTDKWIAAAQKLSPEDVDSFPQNPNPLVMAAGNLLNEKNRYIGCGMLSAIGRMYATCLFSHRVVSGGKLYDTIPKLRSKIKGKFKYRSKQSQPPKNESFQNTKSETPRTTPLFDLSSLIRNFSKGG